MNLIQLARRARLDVDAIRADGVTSALWSDEEVYTAVNTAMDRAARVLRLADSDILTKTLLSTDSSTDYITEVYDPGSLSIVSGTTDYTLPPDYVSIVNLLPITTGFDAIRFRPAKTSQRQFTDNRTTPASDLSSVQNSSFTYSYTIVGGRTLRIAPVPTDAFDVELEYRYRPARLLAYTDGTATFTAASTSVHGTGVSWYTSGLRTPMEIIAGTPEDVVLDVQYQRIDSITDDTNLVLVRAWTGPTGTAKAYTLAMVPTLPEEHHEWLARMTGAIMHRKINLDLAEKSRAALELELTSEVAPEVTMRQNQESIPVEPFDP